MASDYIGINVPPELRQALIDAAAAQGITLSDYVRSILIAAMYGMDANLPGVHQGFELARSLSMQLANRALREALGTLPATFDEALARGYLAPIPDGQG